MKENKIIVGSAREGQRIDNFLLGYFKNIPKSRIYKALRKGEVRVNSGRVNPFYQVKLGDLVRVPPFFKVDEVKEKELSISASGRADLLARILYHDDSIMVIDKPAGLAVHGGSGIKVSLIDSLRLIFNDFSFLELAHRIDRQTSGCLILAKSRQVLLELHQAFVQHDVEKRYLALVNGQWPIERSEIDLPLLRNVLQGGERLVFVDPQGKPSLTKIHVIKALDGMTLVEASPLTGRTHQIRVHLAACGHPIAGDPKYGDTHFNKKLRSLGVSRLMLHARSVCFRLTSMQKALTITAPLPAEFMQLQKS